jgi:hypothetical protein
VQPTDILRQLADHRWVERWAMGKLEVAEGFVGRQLRLAQGSLNPRLIAVCGFQFRQGEQKLGITPMFLGCLLFQTLPMSQHMAEFEALEMEGETGVGTGSQWSHSARVNRNSIRGVAPPQLQVVLELGAIGNGVVARSRSAFELPIALEDIGRPLLLYLVWRRCRTPPPSPVRRCLARRWSASVARVDGTRHWVRFLTAKHSRAALWVSDAAPQ